MVPKTLALGKLLASISFEANYIYSQTDTILNLQLLDANHI